MRWPIIRLIWLRELRDQLRDRRTLFMVAVLPVLLYPVLGFGLLRFALGFKENPSNIGLVPGPRNTRTFPELPENAEPNQDTEQRAKKGANKEAKKDAKRDAKLDENRNVEDGADHFMPAKYRPLIVDGEWSPVFSPDPDDPYARDVTSALRFIFLDQPAEKALADKKVLVVLKASDNFYAALQKGETGSERPFIQIMGDLDDERTQQAIRRLQPVLDAWRTQLKDVRLKRKNLPSAFDVPFEIKRPVPSGGAGSESVFKLMVRVFPFMLVMWSLAGALYPAVDLCAGEKERGTMETLLISPAGREEIVLGKFLTIWVFSGGTAYLNFLSMIFTTSQFGSLIGQESLPLASMIWCMILLLPLSAFFSAISLAVGAYARSSKEGQYYLMPLFLVTMPLIFLTLAPGVELNTFYSLVPVTGVALLMQKLMTTTSLAQVPWLYFIPVLVPIALYSALALRWAIYQFHREEVLFREAERIDIRLWLRRLLHDKLPTPTTGQAFFLFVMLLGLRWLYLSLVGPTPIPSRMAINFLAFVAAPPLLVTIILNTKPLDGLLLKLPSLGNVGLAALLAVLLLPPLATAAELVFAHLPYFSQLLAEQQPLVQLFSWLHQRANLGSSNLPTLLMVYAFLPAVCDELAFRGFILTGLKKQFRPRSAVLLASFLYALFQMNVFLILPAFFMGVVLGLLTLRSRSIYPAMMFHFLCNAVLLGGVEVVSSIPENVQASINTVWPVLASACLLVALWLLWKLYRKPYVELEQQLADEAKAANESALPTT